MKTRKAYGTHKQTGKTFYLGDTVENALKADLSVREYERQLISNNPQLDIFFKTEKVTP